VITHRNQVLILGAATCHKCSYRPADIQLTSTDSVSGHYRRRPCPEYPIMRVVAHGYAVTVGSGAYPGPRRRACRVARVAASAALAAVRVVGLAGGRAAWP
jgi:hypothetical protein